MQEHHSNDAVHNRLQDTTSDDIVGVDIFSSVMYLYYVSYSERETNMSVVDKPKYDTTWDPFYLYGLTLIPTWVSDHIYSKVCEEITYPFPNFNGVTVEVWERINDFIPHFIIDTITYKCPCRRKQTRYTEYIP